MILIDISQVAIAGIFANGFKDVRDLDENLLKHVIFNSIRYVNSKHRSEFGQTVICCDSSDGYWRKDIFPYYKAKRKTVREKDREAWDMIHATIASTIDDLRLHFPYKVMRVSKCEADDVIAVLAKTYQAKEKVLIVSKDKDFAQLQKYPNVFRWSSSKKEMVPNDDPEKALKEHIIRGDEGDGIPNIKSDSDTFVDPTKRQAPIFEKVLVEWLQMDPTSFCTTSTMNDNYRRNESLIDFDNIPQVYVDRILEAYENTTPKGSQMSVLNYLMSHKMRNLSELCNDF